MMKIYASDPLAALLSALWPIKTVPLVRQLMEVVSQNHYGAQCSLVVRAYQQDVQNSNATWRAV